MFHKKQIEIQRCFPWIKSQSFTQTPKSIQNERKEINHEDRSKKTANSDSTKSTKVDEKDRQENLVTVDRCRFTSKGRSSALKLVNRNKKMRRKIAMKIFFLAAIHPSMNVNINKNMKKHWEIIWEETNTLFDNSAFYWFWASFAPLMLWILNKRL